MTGRIPWATWDPIADRSKQTNRPVRVTVHIAVSRSSDIYGPGKGPGGTYAHCYNPKSGRLRQHQELDRKTYADLDGNGSTISVEHEGWPGDRMTDNQIDNMARLFALAVTEHGVPNRIATTGDTRGLAWHRLGCSGNYGRYDRNDPTTWSSAQTGQRWSTARGKTCPTDNFIRQIPDIYERAQDYITTDQKDWLSMATKEEVADAVWEALSRPVAIGGATKTYVGDDKVPYYYLTRYGAAAEFGGRRRHAEVMATLAAQNAAIDAIGKGKVDTAAIVKAVQDAVAEAVAALEEGDSPDPQ